MSELSLYRKYRPQNFADLVGQEPIRRVLQNAMKSNSIAHAYLFCGSRGTGKTSTARLMARAINCENPRDQFEPCGQCQICQSIEKGNLIDLIEIDAASNRGIDEIRDLKEKIGFAPSRAKSKVYIIDEVHMLTKEAFNALLKTLEEPPAHAYFILATTEIHKIPETIVSRCQRFDFKRIGHDDLVNRLQFIAEQENIQCEIEALELIVGHVNGGMRDAIGIFEQISSSGKVDLASTQEILGSSGAQAFVEFTQLIEKNDSASAFEFINELFERGQDLKVFAKDYLWHLRNLMVEAVKSQNHTLGLKYLKMIEVFQQCLENLDRSPIAQIPLEAAVLKLTRATSNPAGKNEIAGGAAKITTAETRTPTTENPPKMETRTSNSDLSQSLILEQWESFIASINDTALRLSMKQTTVNSLVGNKLLLNVDSQFHLDQLSDQGRKKNIEEALKNQFNADLDLELGLKKTAKEAENDPGARLAQEAEALFQN